MTSPLAVRAESIGTYNYTQHTGDLTVLRDAAADLAAALTGEQVPLAAVGAGALQMKYAYQDAEALRLLEDRMNQHITRVGARSAELLQKAAQARAADGGVEVKSYHRE
jgi:hypothetical protein